MRSKEFYSEFNEKIKNLDLEELTDIINNIIRKIPESKYDEILNIFNKNIDYNKEYPYTDKGERLFSLYSIIANASICLVVYEILED